MFAGDDEDGDFLSPSSGAKLASLFGLDQASNHGNESFQYTAPKQPRKSLTPVPNIQKPPAPVSPAAPAVLFATPAQVFKYLDGQYVKQGKLGAAILGNNTTKEYKLLLYLSQQKPVTTAKIHSGFIITLQSNNYCTFYDDQRQNWSLMFDSEKASSDFCKEVCLAKANSSPTLDAVVVQDLSLGEGKPVELEDSLEVMYTGWLLQNHIIGHMFDTNQNKDKLLRLKLGAGKVIKGWEDGILGMKKSGRRLLVIPPDLAYGSKGFPDRIPSNSTLVFETELKRVKFSKDSRYDLSSVSSRDSATPSPASVMETVTPEPLLHISAAGEGRVGEVQMRSKSNSLTEKLAAPDATKAKLISRMAKMGQPMLPFLSGASQPESSDSELEDTGSRNKGVPAAPSPMPISTAAPLSVHAHPYPHTIPASLPSISNFAPPPALSGTAHAFQPYLYTQNSVASSQLQPHSHLYPAHSVSYMGSGDMSSFLMTEARQHNTEVRLAVGKVADKVDHLTSKIDELQKQGNVSMAMSGMSMETSMIMHNIQRIIQENECLKKEVFEKSSRIEEQNHKIGELIDQNQRYMEQSNQLLEKRSDALKTSSEQSQTRLLKAEKDKMQLTDELASSTARLSQLQLEATAHQQAAAELQSKLNSALQDSEGSNHRSTLLKTELQELKEIAEKAQTQCRTEKQKRKQFELKVSNLEEEVQDLKTDKESLEKALADRKNKWQDVRQRRDKEVEDLRRSHQAEVENLRLQLHKSWTSTDGAALEQAEQEQQWRRKFEQDLASAKMEVSELTVQRDTLQVKMTELHMKFTTQEQQAAAVKEELERKVAELMKKVPDQETPDNTQAEVKRVMNGVFHSLRGEFDLGEMYSGQAVLGVIVTTIKNVTLQLLSGTTETLPTTNEKREVTEETAESTDEKPNQLDTNERQAEQRESQVDEEEEDDAEPHTLAVVETEQFAVVEDDQEADPPTGPNALQTPSEQKELSGEGSVSSKESFESVDEEPHDGAAEPFKAKSEDSAEVKSEDTVEMQGPLDPSMDKPFGPPAEPPPPPNGGGDVPLDDTSLTEGTSEENGVEPFFQSPSLPAAAVSTEVDEEELSLKGQPPPAPLFGDDDDDDEDLDWLS